MTRRPAQRVDRGGTTLARRPVRSSQRTEAQPAPVRPAPPPAKQEPRGSFDLGAWVHGIVSQRNDDTPSEPFKQGVVRRDRPERSLDDKSLASWAFGLAPKSDEVPAPRATAPVQRPSTKRKALTMPDLFDAGAVPPCLRDD